MVKLDVCLLVRRGEARRRFRAAEPAEVCLSGPQDESSLCDEGTFRTLCEMFPGVCSLEVRRCLRVAGGDSEEAAQLLLLQQRDPEAGEGSPATLSRGPPHHHSSRQGLAALTLGDKELREQILTRWEGAEVGCSKDTSCLSRSVGDHSCGTGTRPRTSLDGNKLGNG